MPNLTIKNIPDNVLRKVKRKAKLNRRSLNSEVIKNLEDLVTSAKINTNLLIEKAKELRAELNITIDDKFLAEHKNAGRL
ncbi:MAG: Arc family DNA-binding protein [Melioribacteraceae bacterium]|nr:Arc family DNA-binding protein [Melioribacteraceae bacterium]